MVTCVSLQKAELVARELILDKKYYTYGLMYAHAIFSPKLNLSILKISTGYDFLDCVENIDRENIISEERDSYNRHITFNHALPEFPSTGKASHLMFPEEFHSVEYYQQSSLVAGYFDMIGSALDKRLFVIDNYLTFMKGLQKVIQQLGITCEIHPTMLIPFENAYPRHVLVVDKCSFNQFLDVIPSKRIKPSKDFC
ncbi:MAG: hypothetical protein UT24_C0050G0003 [Candidatus Woesebacteria bacterium GW2011_GWB1_39_12]|uniref:Uncharacterized protein n=1 Tax=Candidatus Woesebacteria bacterium GW2011_GWB1_39_12 TaxID=1618574 RepID=A0A0G0LZ97_9BACT|nr:MAG: hypothetical protein UT24_C0050G0003 [Candidatus Woesebacteria bacterium GW2011_GWB1_39_12]